MVAFLEGKEVDLDLLDLSDDLDLLDLFDSDGNGNANGARLAAAKHPRA